MGHVFLAGQDGTGLDGWDRWDRTSSLSLSPAACLVPPYVQDIPPSLVFGSFPPPAVGVAVLNFYSAFVGGGTLRQQHNFYLLLKLHCYNIIFGVVVWACLVTCVRDKQAGCSPEFTPLPSFCLHAASPTHPHHRPPTPRARWAWRMFAAAFVKTRAAVLLAGATPLTLAVPLPRGAAYTHLLYLCPCTRACKRALPWRRADQRGIAFSGSCTGRQSTDGQNRQNARVRIRAAKTF